MTAELQIRATSLAHVVGHAVRKQLRGACIPPIMDKSVPPRTVAYVDHVDVLSDRASVTPDNVVHVPVNVFVVTDAAVRAAPNGTPAGANTALPQLTLGFQLVLTLTNIKTPDGATVTRSVLSLAPLDLDLGPLGGIPGIDATSLAAAVKALLPTLSIDLSPQLAHLGVTIVGAGDIILAGDVVAIRFDPAGAPRSHLFQGQDWGFFIDGPTVEGLLRARIQAGLPKRFAGAAVSATYAPSGDTPHVDLSVAVGVVVAGSDFEIVVDLPTDLALVGGGAPALRATVNWSVHVFSPFPGFIEKILEDAISGQIDPSAFGGAPVGDHVFAIDTALSPVSLLDTLLRYDTARGDPDGMTIGGAVIVPGLYEPAFSVAASHLGKPTRIQLCSKLAQTGSGAPSREPPTLANTTSFGQVDIEGCGAFCDVIVETPSADFQPFVSSPPSGAPLESAIVTVRIPYGVAEAMTSNLTMIVRTPRGVRLVDLGLPPKVQVDANGAIVGALDLYIPDCLRFVPASDGRHQVGWGADPSVFKPRPGENPDWVAYLAGNAGLITKLVSITGLEAGELVTFRSATHAIAVTADERGHLVVPVFLPLAPSLAPALLSRANGRSLAGGRVSVSTAAFERLLTVPGALRGAPVSASYAAAEIRIASRHGDRSVLVTPFGPVASRDEQGQGAETEGLNPQPLPPGPPPEGIAHGEIAGLRHILPIPGFGTYEAAVAVLADGETLLLGPDERGGLRVAGTFDGPIGVLAASGEWAAAALGTHVAVFRVS